MGRGEVLCAMEPWVKAPHPYLNGPTFAFALSVLVLLPSLLTQTKLGPAGMNDAPTQLTSGVWFLFGGVYLLTATRAESLRWMLRFFMKRGSNEAETRVRMVLIGGVCTVVGVCLFVRGVLLSKCHLDGFAVSCAGL